MISNDGGVPGATIKPNANKPPDLGEKVDGELHKEFDPSMAMDFSSSAKNMPGSSRSGSLEVERPMQIDGT